MAMHSMKSNPLDSDGARGSIVLIASTSGYFGGTGVVSYVSSKHGVIGLARASQIVAQQLSVRVNVVAPFFTPTHITSGYSEKWKEYSLPANTTEDVANAIVTTSVHPKRQGHSMMVSLQQLHRYWPLREKAMLIAISRSQATWCERLKCQEQHQRRIG
jgi:NAD(P)-dependent dehydrogenase (short-subunit alcohol dehydrogenase family)